jgi:hypothetical protein
MSRFGDSHTNTCGHFAFLLLIRGIKQVVGGDVVASAFVAAIII